MDRYEIKSIALSIKFGAFIIGLSIFGATVLNALLAWAILAS